MKIKPSLSFKKIFCVVLAMILSILSFSCTPVQNPDTDSQGQTVVIGFSQPGMESLWRVANTESVQEAVAAAGYKLEFVNAQQSQSLQINAIRTFIAQQVDVIVFSPVVESGWDNVLREAKDAGIPVILMDRGIDTSDESLYVTLIGSNFYEEGYRAGEWLHHYYRGQRKGVNIIEYQGTVDSSPTKGRYSGFRDALLVDSKFSITYSNTADFLNSKSMEITRDLIENGVPKGYEVNKSSITDDLTKIDFNDVDVLYSHNDDMTLGAIKIMEENGIRPGADVVIITVDASQQVIDLLKQGRINCVVECYPMLGEQLVETIKLVLDGKIDQIEKVQYSEESIFSQDSDLESIQARGY